MAEIGWNRLEMTDWMAMAGAVSALFFTTRPSEARKYLLIWFQDVKNRLRAEMGRENVEKIVVIKDYSTNLFLYT